MSSSFTFISVIALFCYVFLFMTMLAARKSRMINAFLLVLVAMIFWTGGSLFMRMELWPAMEVSVSRFHLRSAAPRLRPLQLRL